MRKWEWQEIREIIHAMQSEEELKFIWDLVQKIQPKKVLEIGTGCGAMTSMLSLAGAKVVSIDIRGQKMPEWQHGDNCSPGWELLIKAGKVKKEEINITFYELDSRLKSTRDIVQDKYDLLIIDGEHSLKRGAQKDWDLYFSMSPVIAIHDITNYSEGWMFNPDWFPHVFWKKVKDEKLYKTEEFTDFPTGGWGVIFK